MGQLIPISVSGIIFQVEKEAYERLSDYLAEIRRHYSHEENNAILLEVESKILEILNSKTSNRAVSLKYLDVLYLIQTIGHVSPTPEPPVPPRADLEIDPIESIPVYYADDQSFSTKKKKLGRSVKNRKLAGVAEGIGIYFRIDPVFIRLIFIGLSLYRGSALLIYLVLIVVMPNYLAAEELPLSRRIMRDPDDKVLGGVAAGLARYFGIDPIFLRVFFIFSILLGGAGIIAYLILWIAAPLAQTAADRTAMRGKPILFYIDSLVNEANDSADANSPLSKWMIVFLRKSAFFFDYIKSRKVLYGLVQLVFTGLIIYIFLKNLAGPTFNFQFSDNYDSDFFDFRAWSDAKKAAIACLIGIPALLIFIKIIESLLNTKLHISYLKRGLLLVWLSIVLFVGFKGYLFSNSSQSGNGIISIENYEVDHFSSIEIDGQFELEIKKGSKQSVEISTDENLSKYLRVENKSGKLRIFPLAEFGEATQLKIRITAIDVDELSVSGNSKVTIDSLTAPTFSLSADGETELRSKIFVGNLLINNSGSGRFYLQGSATNATINSSGDVDLSAFNLGTVVLDLHMDGQGTARVNVKEDLNVNASGQSEVLYKGNPRVTQDINGEAKVLKSEN